MSAKKIIVGGCSFTDKNYPKFAKPKPLDFKMWPEHIGSMLNKEVINTARCGYGNQAIYHQTLKAIMNNRVDHVFVMWTCWIRQDFLINDADERDYITLDLGLKHKVNDLREYRFNHDEWYDNSFNKNWLVVDYNDKDIVLKQPTMKQIIDTNMNYIYSMQTICEKLNIGYTGVQAMTPIPQFVEGTYNVIPFAFNLVKHPLLEKIENFMGWPMLDSLAGFNIVELCNLSMGSSWRISLEDAHPNEKAQRLIASKIYEYSTK